MGQSLFNIYLFRDFLKVCFLGFLHVIREDLQGSSLSQVTSRNFLSKQLFDKRWKLNFINGTYRWPECWFEVFT